MNLAEEKNKIAKAVLELEEENMVSYLKKILVDDEEIEYEEPASPKQGDPFDRLPKHVQDDIDFSLSQIERGEVIGAEEFLAKLRSK